MPRIIIQNWRTGDIEMVEAPRPALRPVGALIQTSHSIISPGTERMMTETAKKSLVGKALSRPDLVRQFLNKAKAEGFLEAYNLANQRLDTPVPLGYSAAGRILEVGPQVVGFEVGDRIAGTGAEFASHAEINYIPNTLMAKIPDNVADEEAAFAGMGAIALHAVRNANVTLGESVAVVGLGVLGLMAVQMLRSSGARVIAMDLDPVKVEMAKKFGAEVAVISGDVGAEDAVRDATQGRGADVVLVFAATDKKAVTDLILEIAADRARLVIPGVIPLDLPRKILYEKELSLVVSRSGGPGLYDELYEAGLRDYPINQIRWTAGRNMEAFLHLISTGALDLKPLLTHHIDYNKALEFYDDLQNGRLTGLTLGVVLQYPTEAENAKVEKVEMPVVSSPGVEGKVGVGVIGAGLFTRSIMMPSLSKLKLFKGVGVAALESFYSFHLGRKFGFQYASSDYHHLLEDDSIHAIMITTRHNIHGRLVVEALKAGKHVYVEKPLALSAEDLFAIEETLKEHPNQLLMVGFNRRFAPLTEFVSERLKYVSEPRAVMIRCNAGYAPRDSWVHGPSGGGRLMGEACHFFDLISYFSDSVPVRVSAESMKSDAYMKSDNVAINIQLENGSIGQILYVANGPKSYSRERVEVYAGGCVGEIDSFRKAKVVAKEKSDSKQSISTDLGYNRELELFLKAVAEGGSAPISVESLLATSWATLAAEAAIDEHKAYELDEFIEIKRKELESK